MASDGREFIAYPNVRGPIGYVVSSGLATLYELQTIYSLEDMYNLLEIAQVDAINRRIASEPR